MAQIHGGQIVARALRAEGVDTIFTLTGGHIVPILDGCVQEGIRVVDVRQSRLPPTPPKPTAGSPVGWEWRR